MKDPTPWLCDGPGCHNRKGPSNHWWIVYEAAATGGVFKGGLMLAPWDDEGAEVDNVIHACSESCMLKLASDWIEWSKKPKTKDNQSWQPRRQRNESVSAG